MVQVLDIKYMKSDKFIENDGVLNVIVDGSLNEKETPNKETDEVKAEC